MSYRELIPLGLLLLLALGSGLAEARRASNKTVAEDREGKVFNLFNVVQFKNEECRSNSRTPGASSGTTFRNGTCYTSSECKDRGGSASGNCAAGFGVCCVFTVSDSGSEVNNNCSYIQNPDFPNVYTETSSLTYTVNKCSDQVCSIRLDFEAFTIRGITLTDEIEATGACLDTFTVQTVTGFRVPTICGQNTGHHMYVDIGRQDSDSVTVNFNFGGTSNARTWEIKVTQIKCTDVLLPPEGCLQYHTSTNGRLQTFNFESADEVHPPDMNYNICVRQEQGMCCVRYQVCPDDNSFTLETKGNNIAAIGSVDSNCSNDYVLIEDSGADCAPRRNQDSVHNRYCGIALNHFHQSIQNVPICDCSLPFMVGIRAEPGPDGDHTGAVANTILSRGVCLVFDQIPC